MMKTDGQLIDELLDFLDLHDRDALVFWMDHVNFGYEYDISDMVRHEESGRLRPETKEELDEKRRKAQEATAAMRKRWDEGDRSMDVVMWKSMEVYVQKMVDNIFNAKPLMYHITRESDE